MRQGPAQVGNVTSIKTCSMEKNLGGHCQRGVDTLTFEPKQNYSVRALGRVGNPMCAYLRAL